MTSCAPESVNEVQATGAKPEGLPGRCSYKCPKLSSWPYGNAAPSRHCGRFCSCENLTVPQLSIPPNFAVLNLKGLREMCRVDLLVPNQIPTLIEIYRN